jgi:glutaredoxin 3
MNNSKQIVVYSKQHCPFCRMARQMLDNKGVNYELIDIEGKHEVRERMIELSGRKTVPQIFFGDHHVGGFDDLNALEQKGDLDQMLADVTGASA